MGFKYKIGYYTYEESEYVELEHEELFSDEEISQMIGDAVISEISKAEKEHHGYNYLHEGVIDYLIKEKGFTRIEYHRFWEIFGWASLFMEGEWEEMKDDDHLNYLQKRVKEAGFSVWDDIIHESKTERTISNLAPNHHKIWK